MPDGASQASASRTTAVVAPDASSDLPAANVCGSDPTVKRYLVFGRCSRLVLDSWTRPRYAQLVGKKIVADRTIERRFARYGEHAGRAFWLALWKSRHLREDRRV